jgi:sugar/nucleoside kinase (ribokinase family)
MSLLVFGTVALDNLKTPSGVRKDLLGGSAAHFCMSSRLFNDIHLAGVVGNDFPKKHVQMLKSKGVNTDSLLAVEGKTFRWDGEYKKEDMNQAVTHATELGVLTECAAKVSPAQSRIGNVFLANIGPDMQMHFMKQLKNPKFVGLDSMNLWINIMKPQLLKIMKKVNMFVLNDAEARSLTGESNLIMAAKALRKKGPQLIVIKKGEHGVLFYSDKYSFAFPAFPVEKVVDPTGAGDTFAGGLMGYLSKVNKVTEKNLKKAVIYATTLASFNVEGFGVARTSKLTMGDVNGRMRELISFINPK